MGKTHEALERAAKEFQKKQQEFPSMPSPEAVVVPPRRPAIQSDKDRYEDLKTNILTRYTDGSIKTILFAATTHGDGCSTTSLNFATTLAKDSRLKVLLIEVNLRTASLHEVFNIDDNQGLSAIVKDESDVGGKIKKVGAGNLFVIPCGGKYTDPVALLESEQFSDFLEKMRDRFDYIILDAPPVPNFSECRALCARVDGAVLVIKSGKTRRQVALRAKRQMEEAGGKLLGVVLNKKKYYIPDWIYRRL